MTSRDDIPAATDTPMSVVDRTTDTPAAGGMGAALLPESDRFARADRRALIELPRTRPSLRGALLRRITPRLVARATGGPLELRTDDGRVLHGPGAAEAIAVGRPDDVAVLHVHHPNFWRRCGTRGQLGFGESFMAGEWSTPDLARLLEVLAETLSEQRTGRLGQLIRAGQRLRPAWYRPSTKARAKQQITYHYDLGNRFFEGFLDESMTYSCAVYERPDMTLGEAQASKYRRICEQVELTRGDRVAEIGCGWGGFAEFAAREYGAHVTGVTISDEQHAYATERMRRVGLDDLVDIRLQDYRTLEGTYDKVVSIEMLEAVGPHEYERYFATLDRLLAPGGRACVQVIGFQDRQYRTQLRASGWVRRYIFPGGMLPTPTVLTRAMTAASQLQLHNLHEIGHHYVPTLRAWRDRMLVGAGDLRDAAGTSAFVRAWEYYLAYCEAGFKTGVIRDMQLTLTRAGTVDAPPVAEPPYATIPGGKV